MRFKRFNRKVAFALSVCMMIVWALMGAGTTVAWFTDTTPVTRNTFIIGDLKLAVYYKNDTMTDYKPVDAETPVFNDQALYEPGYTQVVYLKIENAGNVDFNYRLSVTESDYRDSQTKTGLLIHLPDHLKFGVIFAASEPELDRELARMNAGLDLAQLCDLSTYSQEDDVTMTSEDVRYAALIVYMPESVGNEANHDPNMDAPYVELGVTVYAQQAGTKMPAN